MCRVLELRYSRCNHTQLYIPIDTCPGGFRIHPAPGSCSEDWIHITAAGSTSPIPYCNPCIRAMSSRILRYWGREIELTTEIGGPRLDTRIAKCKHFLLEEMAGLYAEIGGFERWYAATHDFDAVAVSNQGESGDDGIVDPVTVDLGWRFLGVVLGLGVADVVMVFDWVFWPFCRLVAVLDLLARGLEWFCCAL